MDEARDACQSLYSGDDARLLQLIHAAVAYIDGSDGVLGRAIMPQQWRMSVTFPGIEVDIPLPPLIDVVSVAVATSDAPAALLANGYTITGQNPGTLTLPGPSYSICDIIFECGYTEVPENLRLAILMLVRHWYDHPGIVEVGRIAMHALPMAVDSLLAPFKVQSV